MFDAKFIQIIATLSVVTFLGVTLAFYYCVIAMRCWICNGTEADFPLEVRLIYALLFNDVIVEANWYTPIPYSNFSKINIKMSLMRMSTMNLAKCWMTTSCLAIWTQKGGETPTKMVTVLLFVEYVNTGCLYWGLAAVHNDKAAFVFRSDSFLISTLETHAV